MALTCSPLLTLRTSRTTTSKERCLQPSLTSLQWKSCTFRTTTSRGPSRQITVRLPFWGISSSVATDFLVLSLPLKSVSWASSLSSCWRITSWQEPWHRRFASCELKVLVFWMTCGQIVVPMLIQWLSVPFQTVVHSVSQRTTIRWDVDRYQTN